MTVREYPHIPVTDTGFRNIKMEITTATAPFAFPSTWHSIYDLKLTMYDINKKCMGLDVIENIAKLYYHLKQTSEYINVLKFRIALM